MEFALNHISKTHRFVPEDRDRQTDGQATNRPTTPMLPLWWRGHNNDNITAPAAAVNSRSRSLCAVARPSVVCLSVCNARAP